MKVSLNDESLPRFKGLLDEAGLTPPDAIDAGLTLLEWAIAESKKGRHIVAYDPVAKMMEQVVMECFPDPE